MGKQADILRLIANDVEGVEASLSPGDIKTIKRCAGSILATALKVKYKKRKD